MSNPCVPPQTPKPVRGTPPWPFWFLLGLPPFLCYGVMNIARIIPAGLGWFWISWLTVGIVPVVLAVSAAMIVAQILGNASKLLQIVLCCIQIPAVIVVWQQTFQILVTSWR